MSYLLGPVSEAPGLVGTRGLVDAHHGGELAVLPAAHAQQEAHGIRLLASPDLLDVLVRPWTQSHAQAQAQAEAGKTSIEGLDKKSFPGGAFLSL